MSFSGEGRRKVFVSYSHNDGDWLKRLQIHLKPLERRGLVEFWDDTKIRPGDQWRKEISDALDSAKIAVLLISADFLASDFIAENELPPLLTAAEKDGVLILPLILKPSLFIETESLSKFQSVNPPSEPLIKLSPGEQEEYFLKLSKAVLRAIEDAQNKSAKLDGAMRARIFNPPFPRNRFFTGRDDILEQLHNAFNSGETVQALNGLGGIGKTQTAVEYSYRHRQDYKNVLWCKAYSREVLLCDLAAIAVSLNLCEKDEKDQSLIVAAAKRWLEDNDSWLLILDNADDLAMAREFIPSRETGHVLLTTRAQNTRPIAVRQAVEMMEPRDGALFLLRRLEMIKKGEPLESAPEEVRSQAEALSKAVDGLPLALDQAAAFIEEIPSTLGEYLCLYQNECIELLSRRGELSNDHREPVSATFSLAFKKVAEASPSAADLLRLCAFLEADAIPEEIFREGAGGLGDALNAVTVNAAGLIEAIKEAGRFSLLRRDPERQTVSLHRLVQRVLKDEMNKDEQRMWAERAVRAVNHAFPAIEYSKWQACDRVIFHARALARVIDEFGFEFLDAARLMNKASAYLDERAQYVDASLLCERALAIIARSLGPDHPDFAENLNLLALLKYRLGRYVEAEPLYLRALAIRERTLGPEHPDFAKSLNDLAELYVKQKKLADAEPLLLRAIAIRERALGPEHPDFAESLHDLAGLYSNQRRYVEAEPLYKRVLAIIERALGPEHPDFGTILMNLAMDYKYPFGRQD